MPTTYTVVEVYHKGFEIVQAEHLACMFEVLGGPGDCVCLVKVVAVAAGADLEVQFCDKTTVSTRT